MGLFMCVCVLVEGMLQYAILCVCGQSEVV